MYYRHRRRYIKNVPGICTNQTDNILECSENAVKHIKELLKWIIFDNNTEVEINNPFKMQFD